ncbi:venom protease-like [Orussus abietinus]|uniref:venom protease-like n=1 Tax=Orussus abietinus TaxID=222816 RepID=UPI0006268378|nr:venom protease-like [Orussus abietinus]
MRTPLALVVFLYFLLRSVSSQGVPDSACTTTNQPGVCIGIRQCTPLLNILRTQRQAAGDFLRSTVCGYVGFDPLVCCPTSTSPTPPTSNQNQNNDSTIVESRFYGPLLPEECGISNNTNHGRVVGGDPAPLGAWPWIVALGYRSNKNLNQNEDKPKWLCGGTLISSRHVLTAGHCVFGRKDLYLTRLGDLDLSRNDDGATPVDILIEKKIIHPNYDSVRYTNDIAILRLNRDVTFTDLIRPICLPVTDEMKNKNLVRHYPFLAGWGSVYFNGPSSSRLLEVQVPVVDPADCKRTFEPFKTVIDDRVLCAGFARGGKDACQGDSGGPLMYPKGHTFYLIGVVSYGFRCAEPGFPGVYTRVTSFLDFIEQNLV